MKIGENIKAKRLERGMTLSELERRTGIGNGNLSRLERGKQSLTNDSMTVIAEAFGITLSELFSENITNSSNIAGKKENRSASASRPISFYRHLTDIPEGVNLVIDGIKLTPSDIGTQGPLWTVDESKKSTFMLDDVRNLNSSPCDLFFIEIKDDTMQPRLFPGDDVIVDTKDTEIPDSGGVFAVIIDKRTIAVRRLFHRAGGSLLVVCDNTTYPAMTIPAADAEYVQIIGRVKVMRGSSGF